MTRHHLSISIPIFLSALSVAATAYADKTHCTPLAIYKEHAPKEAKWANLTPGQLNFANGAYFAIPPMGMPDGTAAKIVMVKEGGLILWTRGSLVCDKMAASPAFIDAMLGVKTGPTNDGGEEF